MAHALIVACLALSAGISSAVYNEGSAIAYAYLSAAAYCDPGPVNAWNCAACRTGAVQLVNVNFMQDTQNNNFAYVGRDAANTTYVAWRGTANVQQWLANLDFIKTAFPGCSGCNVHSGFYSIYTILSSQVLAALDRNNGVAAPNVVLTGHSLGGAQANLGAFELALAGYPVALVYNYGQPRVGDGAYAAGFQSFVVNGQDGGAVAVTPAVAAAARSEIAAALAGGRTLHIVADAVGLNPATAAATSAAAAPLSAVMLRALQRALMHPANALLLAADADAALAASLLAALRDHAAKSLAYAQRAVALATDRAGAASASGAAAAAQQEALALELASLAASPEFALVPLSSAQRAVLAALRFPVAQFVAPGTTAAAAAASASSSAVVNMSTARAAGLLPLPGSAAGSADGVSGFSGAQYYRVTHWRDIVPHVPPQVVGFSHSAEEVWYVEDSSAYSDCDTANGEDPACSDSLTLDLSIPDHLTYINIPISNSC